jgi:hypothetical protein
MMCVGFINPQQVLGFPFIGSFRGQNNRLLLNISKVFVLLFNFFLVGLWVSCFLELEACTTHLMKHKG